MTAPTAPPDPPSAISIQQPHRESRKQKPEGHPTPMRSHPASTAKLGRERPKVQPFVGSPEQRRQAVLGYLVEYIALNQFSPTVREIMRGLGISSTSVVNYWLQILEAEGLIVSDKIVSRSSQITTAGYLAAGKQPPVRGTLVIAQLCDRCAGCMLAEQFSPGSRVCVECRP